jgi:phosphatidylserine/phosphatidylglycerophosphate/cardiolipin synthase-like enzyme
MQIGDTRFVNLVADQQVIKDLEKKQKAEDSEEPVDAKAEGPEGAPPQLMDPERMMSLVRQKTFSLGDVQETVEELKLAKGFRGSEKELQKIGRELKELHGELKSGEALTAIDAKRLEWVNLAQDGVKYSLEGIRKTRRNLQWEKVTAQGGAQPPPIYEAYFKETGVPVDEMHEILSLTEDLHSEHSRQKIGGNIVTPLLKGAIWSTKMNLLDEAIKNPLQDGKPVEVDVEYYELSSPEMIKRLRAAATNGAKVRVLMDPGHLEGAGKGTYDATSLAVRSETVHTLLDGMQERDIGVTLFPNKEVLGSRDRIMHRKLFRVGETVVFGGMNANTGSGENVDFAMKIAGPATRRFGELFNDDVAMSSGKGAEDIYGNQIEALRTGESVISCTGWGFEGLLGSALKGDVDLTGKETREERLTKLLNGAKEKGIKVASLADFPDVDNDGRVSSLDVRTYLLGKNAKSLTLTAQGRELLASQMESTVDLINGDRNKEKLADITPSEGSLPAGMKGNDVLAIGNSSVERQALVLDAINSADRFIKVSAFVLNDDMAKLLIEKKREKEGKGESFQVQVIMDPGVYGYGGTPNEAAYKRLEDAGVQVKWSLLDRTDPEHDRKNHSKLIITDRMVLTGSTNFSDKGLRTNWEVNDVAYFNEENPESMKKQAEVVKDYDRMWAREAISIDTVTPARNRYGEYGGDDRKVKIEKYRGVLIRDFIKGIETFEIEMGSRLSRESKRGDIQEALARRTARGENQGYALLASFPDDKLDEIRRSLPAWRHLQEMRRSG